jgi:hypothetical protein
LPTTPPFSAERRYIEVDDQIVVGRLKGLSDLDEFVNQVAAYATGV